MSIMKNTNKWWSNHVEQMKLRMVTTSLTEFMKYCQSCGLFDHRVPYNQELVDFKIKKLKEDFGELPDIKESELSIHTENGYSNIFLWHLNFYLRITKVITPKSILEIGGGYGGLARIFKTLHPEISYTIIDLPESLYFSKKFLELNSINDVLLIPAGEVPEKKEFDIVINTGSFQEMFKEVVKEYIDMIQNDLKVKYLYSCNYGIISGGRKETNFWGNLPIDNQWEEIYRNENNPIVNIDVARKRIFWEIYLKRKIWKK